MKLAPVLLSASLALGLIAVAPEAEAFCLTRGCRDKSSCNYDSQGCLLEDDGPLLHWTSRCLSFDLQQDGSVLRHLAYPEANAAVQAAFKQWLSADCGDGRRPNVEVQDYGPVECHTAEYNQDSSNANIIMFRDDDWPYKNSIDTLALTTLIFNAESGEIYDADIEINTHMASMSIGEVGPLDIDFASVITHEVGHFLGLSHSESLGSTMRPSYAPGETEMASIERDDVKGICAAWPADRQIDGLSCDPRHGFTGRCAPAETACSVSPRPSHNDPGLWAMLAAVSSGLLRKRLRRAGRRP